ncbi:unnamed protein product [Tuber aestivum]|uniref:Nudix hydrolase domain-containing protein n=1 Tax=Tuber aestivum TaxID=59557 RepID=A0A292Q0P2_9PEZI|nr:unnamed protein product [Tuber aestivum]
MSPADLILGLHRALEELTENPPPSVPSPEEAPKRASVALVVRVQPHPSYLPASIDSYQVGCLSEFFEQPWVKRGDPECLFIKRAARKGDRWTSHVALPGGKRDGEDEDDHKAAVRECLEEVGLDLDSGVIIDCGKLPDRVVTTSWGTVPLMVLCPFVFLCTSPTAPSFTLQPTEVASAHWVPIRTLLSPTFRTVQKCDVSDRLSRRFSGPLEPIVRWGLRANLGQMEYSAVRLWPSISVFSSFSGDFLDGAEAGGGSWDRPLLLWGLTLGVVTDFLEMLPHGQGAAGWTYPTFTSWDVRGIVWLMTREIRKRNWEAARRGSLGRAFCEHEDTESSLVLVEENGNGTANSTRGEPTSTVKVLLEGYYDVVRKAVWVTLGGRAVIASTALGAAAWRYTRR